MAAFGRVRQPRLILFAWNSNGDPSRLCATYGSKRTLDGNCLWFNITDHSSLYHHIFHQLAKDGLFISSDPTYTGYNSYTKTTNVTNHLRSYTCLKFHWICVQAEKARDRVFSEKSTDPGPRYHLLE